MNERNWTPEPWVWNRLLTDGGAPIITADMCWKGRFRNVAKILFDGGSEDPEVHGNANRIVSCVNACAPIGKPEKLGELLAAAIVVKVSLNIVETSKDKYLVAISEAAADQLLRAIGAMQR